jgi:hypothetical protein
VSNVHVTNVYNRTVINNVTINHVSYNGGTGGITARPTAEEQAAANERHVPPTSLQAQHAQAASSNRKLYESANHGKPPIAATAKPGEFKGGGVKSAKAAAPEYKPATARSVAPAAGNTAASRPGTPVHPNDLPPVARTAPNTGNPKLDKKYQQDQEKLAATQDRERLQLQQKQDQDHQKMAQKKANAGAQQQLEQKHQQQTQQLAQRHAAQQQSFQTAHAPAARR